MLNHDGYASLTHLYDAAINQSRWRRALDAVASAVGGEAIALLIRRADPSFKDLTMLNSAYLGLTRTPAGIYYGLVLSRLQNPDWEFLSRQPVHHPTPDTAIGPTAEQLDKRRDYAFLRKRLGISRRLGIRLNSDKVWFDAMSIAFSSEHSNAPVAAMRDVLPLLPHITKAVEIGRTFAQLKSRYAAVLTALDRVKVGLAIAMPSGDIVVHNEEASRIFSMKDGLSHTMDGHLRCSDSDEDAQLRHYVSSAANTARGEADHAENLMTITRRSDASPFLLDVAPLRDSANELGSLEGALITIIDPERVPHLKMERFVALYELTPAEAEVCALILQGMSVSTIAETRNTSPTTVKNQIAAILSKTGVNRRAELIRLVIRVLPPVE